MDCRLWPECGNILSSYGGINGINLSSIYQTFRATAIEHKRLWYWIFAWREGRSHIDWPAWNGAESEQERTAVYEEAVVAEMVANMEDLKLSIGCPITWLLYYLLTPNPLNWRDWMESQGWIEIKKGLWEREK